jgi:NDP-sugar pyrophosphorylase family protein
MQVVVLAGGLGTRLRPITETVPKPMVEVGGQPFLEYIVRHLAAQGFREVLVLLGYLGSQIQEYFGDGTDFGVRMQYSFEAVPMGTAGAICSAHELLEGDFLVLYGDSYLPIDYRPVTAAFRQLPCLGLIVVYDNRLASTGVVNNVAADDEGWVTRYEKGTGAPGLDYVEAGVLCFRRELFEGLAPGGFVSLEKTVYPQLIGRRQLRAFITPQRFYDIGTPERLEEFVAARK